MAKKRKKSKSSRRKFIRTGITLGALTVTGSGIVSSLAKEEEQDSEKIKLLNQDGKLVEVASSKIKLYHKPAVSKKARKGISGRKFVMVIDLSKCGNARKCIDSCQKGHNLATDQEWIRVHLMKDNQQSDPYWFPKPCYHCDNPPCVKVCPVGATFKRSDNCVLIDVNRCIGCKFCISACPYSVRIFNWKDRYSYREKDTDYSPETSVPGQVGTVGKCDFCPDKSRNGELPYCISSCPMGALYFGDINEDTITNGDETLRFKKTIEERAGYRYLEELGTEPNVYYLPPVDRMYPFERGLKDLTEEQKARYNNVISKLQSDNETGQ
ncbi:MAG: 4Fe-4S dicluster domain-containing protein [Bacteroidales bacterium]|nr:MAG: 4Fe-4S dicluster domain-containing protein [Bacteroidales bacterium]